jgi:hypothetical protein
MRHATLSWLGSWCPFDEGSEAETKHSQILPGQSCFMLIDCGRLSSRTSGREVHGSSGRRSLIRPCPNTDFT